jgi:hypothetical protein
MPPDTRSWSAMRKIAFAMLGTFLITGSLLSSDPKNSGSAWADEAVLEEMVGDGMHAYFNGDFAGAYNTLSAAERDGTRDPRVYYYRGLAELRLGRESDARADFEKGAALEAADGTGRYRVGQSLERIQGPARLALERFREQGRMVAFQREQEQQQHAYAQQGSGRAILLRHDAEVVTPPPASPPPVNPPAVNPPAANPSSANPSSAAAAGGPPTSAPPNKAPPADTAKTPDVVDPFGGAAAAKPAELPAGPGGAAITPVGPPATAPDGTPAAIPVAPATGPAAGVPAVVAPGTVVPAVVAPGAVAPAVVPPAEKPAAGDSTDPFGGGTATKSASKSADKPAANDPANPFGDPTKPAGTPAKPAEKPAAPPADKPTVGAPASSPDTGVPAKTKPGALGSIFRSFGKAAIGDTTDSAPTKPVVQGNAIPTLPPATVPPTGANDNPFGNPPTPKAAAPAGTPPVNGAAKPAADNPFGDDPTPAAKNATKSAPAAKPADPQMKKSDNPFGN